MHENSLKNLKPIQKGGLSNEEAKKRGAKGGLKRGENIKRNNSMKEMLNYLLDKDIENKDGDKVNTLEALMIAQIKEALKGNTKAVQFIRDTIGELPTQNVVATNTNVNIDDENVVNEVLKKLKDL